MLAAFGRSIHRVVLSQALLLAAALPAQDVGALLDQAEERLRQVYEQGRYGARRFQAVWLPDSSGYVIRPGGGARLFVDVETGQSSRVTDAQRIAMRGTRQRSPNGKWVFEQRDGNLFARSLGSQQRRQLTANDRSDVVSYSRVSWSADSRFLAFVESDVSNVRIRTDLLGDEPTYPSLRERRFARVGGEIARLRVGIASVETEELRWVDLDAPDEGIYLGQVEWSQGELLIEVLSRFRDRRRFVLADPDDGSTRTIFEESDPAWVVASYAVNNGLEWLEGGDQFLVIHERSGWRHAYVHARSGEQLVQLTTGDYDIIERASVDEASGVFYFLASPQDASRRALYRVPLDGSGAAERVTPTSQQGTHEYRFSPDHRYAFHTWSGFDEPPVTELVELPSHRVLRVLEDNLGLRSRAQADGFGSTEFLQLDVDDEVTVDAWLMKPKDFDPSKKWPVLVYVYSEPHAQTVLDRWGAAQAAYHRVVTDLGYLVLSIDSRGTPAPKGAAWRRAVFGSLGPLSTKEQAAALREFGEQRDYVDMSRIGIWGWSGGGSNTLNAMFREPDLYHVGIAVAAKPQPWLYNAWFQEIYMETRETNPEGYQQSAPIHFAEGLQGDLLIIHGTGELNTHVQITEGLVDRLIELGKRFDYMTYPHRRHGISEGSGTTVHLRSLMVRYLLDHLPPGGR